MSGVEVKDLPAEDQEVIKSSWQECLKRKRVKDAAVRRLVEAVDELVGEMDKSAPLPGILMERYAERAEEAAAEVKRLMGQE